MSTGGGYGGGIWEAVGRIVLGGVQKSGLEGGKVREESQRNALNQPQRAGMQMSKAPEMDQEVSQVAVPSKIFPKALEIPGDSSLSWTQASRDADAKIFAPTQAARGGFMMGPANVDSSKPTHSNSGMQQYLNYMKYRS